MLRPRDFLLMLLLFAAVLASLLVPARVRDRRGSLRATAGIENADPDTDITGIVVDTRGRPVAGARITTDYRIWGRVRPSGPDELRAEIEGPETVTARDGTFLLEVGRGEIIDLCIRPQVLGETMSAWRRPGDHLRIVVTDGADLTVTVRDGKGKLLPDTRVFVLYRTPFGKPVHWHSGMTNAKGQYRYPNLSAAEVRVFAVKADHISEDPWITITIPASGAVSVEVILHTFSFGGRRESPPRSIEGRVVAPEGTPIERARIVVGPDTGRTDAAGHFHLDLDVPVRKATVLAVWAPGYGRIVEQFGGWEGVREFRLSPGRTVSGRVTDESGHPLAECAVELVPDYPPGLEVAITDARGTYRFADVAPGRYEVVGLRRDGYRVTWAVDVPADADPPDVDITIR